MKLFIASDHAGVDTKKHIIEQFKDIEFVDLGPETKDSVHYPNFAFPLVKEVLANNGRGILICGTGIGMSIAANRFKNIRASLCCNTEAAKFTRLHNNSNVLCLGARITAIQDILEITKTWINTEFEGGRHQERVNLFNDLGSEAP